MNEVVTKYFDQIKFECRPNKDRHIFEEVFHDFFGDSLDTESNFVGGINDHRNTLHENMFQAMHPKLRSQVHFGTGEGGYKKYLSKRYTADFYDEEKKTIFEIDGDTHKTIEQSIKDKIRDYFFIKELGIRTIRYTNDEVEEMVIERLNQLYEGGVLDEYK